MCAKAAVRAARPLSDGGKFDFEATKISSISFVSDGDI